MIDLRLTVHMLRFFAGTGTTAHSDILNGASEPGRLMSFKMTQADEDIRIHHCTTDLSFAEDVVHV